MTWRAWMVLGMMRALNGNAAGYSSEAALSTLSR